MIVHPIEPVYDKTSRVLILGSFPSVKSREQGFFYGHPQNRFWKVLAALFAPAGSPGSSEGEPVSVPGTIEEKKAFLLKNHVAVWDVIHSCDITGSSDASIRNVTINDLSRILTEAPIRQIFVNGQTTGKLYRTYTQPLIGREAVVLPSTSPANARWRLEMLVDAWSAVAEAAR